MFTVKIKNDDKLQTMAQENLNSSYTYQLSMNFSLA